MTTFVSVNLSLSINLGYGKAAIINTKTPDTLDNVFTAATLCISNALAYR